MEMGPGWKIFHQEAFKKCWPVEAKFGQKWVLVVWVLNVNLYSTSTVQSMHWEQETGFLRQIGM